MTAPILAPYGSWTSPITADLIVASTIGLVGTALDHEMIYWQEMRPQEGGRNVIVGKRSDGSLETLTPPPWNVRNRVHEYGGGSFTVAEGKVYFTNFADQRLYRQTGTEAPVPLTPEGGLRYADGEIDRYRQRWIGVREDHRPTPDASGNPEARQEAENTIVAVPLNADTPEEGTILVSGQDFYAAPRLSPDGSQLAWLSWVHPQMPWDGTELWVAPVLADGSLGEAQKIAGGPEESIVQPEWSPQGVLHFVSDRSNWWNLYRWHQGDIEALCPKAAEFGQPQWIFGQSSYGFLGETEILCIWSENGQSFLGILDTTEQALTPLNTPYRDLGGLNVNGKQAVLIGATPDRLSEVVCLSLASLRQGEPHFQVLKKAGELKVDPAYFSKPEPLTFPTANGEEAYGIYYPPCNPDYQAPPEERPPLLVKSHGGPTSATRSSLNLGIQYWTSRGFAVLDVNYRGSTGYGRAYREKLKGCWGIADVADCAYGAKFLVERGSVDNDRLAIDGGSAGGYTTLCALTFTDVFKAGASRYGVSDLTALTQDTHKFESRYLDSLVGPYPEAKAIYEARSPIHHTKHLNCPVIFFQGLEDRIVPPNQAETIVEVLKQKGIPVAYVPFPEEQHGFRKAENIKRSLEGELYFYAQVFGFALAEAIEPVEIFNL
ncbi:MAG: S9 family peptidase [Prochlorotrichaceae cyanobacterium]